ncbi:MAG TPA: enolase C-terminal domain-like protein, partial [Caldilineaceae bacterium]|nr:enolase C-terminal domain-like protein [Caldilineaceae bacterium]
PADDLDGYAELTHALDLPVATGENLYTAADFARFLQRGAVDIIQPDLRRAGGPTALLQIGLMIGAAYLSYKYVEQPFRRHGIKGTREAIRRWSTNPSPAVRYATPAVCVALVALAI